MSVEFLFFPFLLAFLGGKGVDTNSRLGAN